MQIQKIKAFSLIELMVVIAIVALLAAVATPSYTEYMARARLAPGVAAAKVLIDKSIEYAQLKGKFPTGQEIGVMNPDYSVIQSTLPEYALVPNGWGNVQGDSCGKVQQIALYWDANKLGLTNGDIVLGTWNIYHVNGTYRVVCFLIEGAYGWAGPWSNERYLPGCYNSSGGYGGDDAAAWNADNDALAAQATCH